jgi:hypothetical protein
MKLRQTLVLAAFVPCIAGACASVPVVIGAHGSPELDACPTLAEIAADGFILNAPDVKPSLVLPIAQGVRVYLCGSSPDGEWEGVVVAADGKDCGVSTPVDAPSPYAGPCASGWIRKSAARVIAG